MPDWLSMLKAYVDTLETRLTAGRAALLDEITAARLEELDPANLPADIDTLLTRLSAIRAGYIDQLDFDLQGAIAALPAVMVGTDNAATVADGWDAALATILDNFSAVRIGYIDQLDFNLQEDIAALQTDLDNPAQYKADLSTLETRLSALRAGYLDELAAGNLPTDIAAINTLLSDGVYGLAALEALVDDLETRLSAVRAGYLDFLDTAESAGPFSYLDAGGEQDVVEDSVTTRRHIWVEFSNRNMAQTGTFRIYRKVDGANYDLYAEQPVLVAAGEERAFDAEFTTNQHWKLTYQEDVNEGAARAIPFNIITQVVE